MKAFILRTVASLWLALATLPATPEAAIITDPPTTTTTATATVTATAKDERINLFNLAAASIEERPLRNHYYYLITEILGPTRGDTCKNGCYPSLETIVKEYAAVLQRWLNSSDDEKASKALLKLANSLGDKKYPVSQKALDDFLIAVLERVRGITGDGGVPDEFLVLTDDELVRAGDDFVDSLMPRKIEALASRYNGGRTCRIVGEDRGSYNACFFVKFDDDNETWVVRIPIEPALHNPWQALLSEVATMKVRTNLLRQLLGYLAEIRSIELPAIGSLKPTDDASRPTVGALLTQSSNDARRDLPRFVSAKAYMDSQFDLISSYLLAPRRDHPEDEVRYDMFCISSMKSYFDTVIQPELDSGPFVLSHPDLRPSNIIVNERSDIVGIIDWQFTSTVPRQLCTPPSWVTGHVKSDDAKMLLLQFSMAIILDDTLPKELELEWLQLPKEVENWRGPSSPSFHVAHLMRCPADLNFVFWKFVAQGRDAKELEETEAKLFQNPGLASEARRIAERNRQYTEYLKSQGRYVEES
ncbi:hypothetical protein UVI_02047550 [Ustilaginoidea virens]|uniref:Aminoglycoside phosphotransferase domain-containing protein n=1 Tax=Ustilaginoidea virens TaxID=1159556 RepID=A0A1B5L4Z8_USTVR|nr:hypothetical protein UVI_02047550 [Ustilaginoidea virens]